MHVPGELRRYSAACCQGTFAPVALHPSEREPAVREINVAHVEPERFAESQASTERKLEQEPIASSFDLGSFRQDREEHRALLGTEPAWRMASDSYRRTRRAASPLQ